jgi:hypothetical protein
VARVREQAAQSLGVDVADAGHGPVERVPALDLGRAQRLVVVDPQPASPEAGTDAG